ncbi:MAG: 5'-methylthioadenosine/adenosylhomocysteine nucleosidase [Endozoicomonadaceae bacterium]|nr:5'-methylthioadenosine/adenosylhomocysteine nucleosidase [Endozoicomonadaceae bacterium]
MKIAILAAMDEEIEPLKKFFSCKKQTGSILSYDIANWHHFELIFLKTGVGKVTASIRTTQLIQQVHPDYILTFGTVGSISPYLEIGDFIISDTVCYHDVDLTSFDYQYGELPETCFPFPMNLDLITCVKQAFIKSSMPYHIGLVASGDVFLSQTKQVERLRQYFPKLLAVDMECAAIAHVCCMYSMPLGVISVVSDFAGEKSVTLHLNALEKVSFSLADGLIPILTELENQV